MEVYLQEVMVTTFSERIQPKTRFLISLCPGEFAAVLERVIAFLDTGIPPEAPEIRRSTMACGAQATRAFPSPQDFEWRV
jgi:hypothetical protein